MGILTNEMKHLKFCWLLTISFILTNCTSLDDVNKRLDTLEEEVTDLKSAMQALQTAYDDGKIVKSVTPLSSAQGGWLITFSDDTNIKLENGKDGVDGKDGISPQVRINSETFHWEMSTDGGVTWKDLDIVAQGKDGISPLVQINASTYRWEVSSDGGQTWIDTGVVAIGKDGDAFFKSVVIKNGFVTFELVDGTIFMFKMDSDVIIPKLLSMEFLASVNPDDMIENVTCTIIGDSVVDCWVHHIMNSKQLIPHFSFEGESVSIDGEDVTSDVTRIDFKKPVVLTVKSSEQTKEYKIYVHAFTGLPVLWIETEGRAGIVSKDAYVNAHFKLVEDVLTKSAGEVTEVDGQIKGRGNSTWSMPKKPYRLKFGSKVSFLSEPKDKSWVLLANYADKTSLRNATAFYMGSISNLEYTPHFQHVDVMLNGQYNGTYQLGDHLKISKDRVNVGDDGFLMEIDARASGESDSRYFTTPHLPQPVNIKDPDVEYDDENFNYAKDFVTAADAALFSDDFTNVENGWQKYMDIESFVDWYLINEIGKNNDACFFSSCYMNLKRGEKLKMGPLWDFDIAFGNVNYNNNYEVTGFWIKGVAWYSRLFQDPVFVAKVKERFDYFYTHQSDIMNFINERASYLKYSVIENNNKWGTFYNYTWPNYDIWGSYNNEVQSMKIWIKNRMEWLKTEFDKM